MVRHNNIISNNHFHKDWQRFVHLHFDQPMQKIRRRKKRVQKARSQAPIPIRKLRPMTRCPTIRYNTKVRIGRGFNLQELRAANLHPKYAATIGIAVDKRRRYSANPQANIRRLKEYIGKLIVLPDKKAEQVEIVKNVEDIFPKPRKSTPKPIDIQKARILADEIKQAKIALKREKKKNKKLKVEETLI